MTILVTGATGTVGRVVVDRLLRAGWGVRALTRNPAAAGLPGEVDATRTRSQGDADRDHALEQLDARWATEQGAPGRSSAA